MKYFEVEIITWTHHEEKWVWNGRDHDDKSGHVKELVATGQAAQIILRPHEEPESMSTHLGLRYTYEKFAGPVHQNTDLENDKFFVSVDEQGNMKFSDSNLVFPGKGFQIESEDDFSYIESFIREALYNNTQTL